MNLRNSTTEQDSVAWQRVLRHGGAAAGVSRAGEILSAESSTRREARTHQADTTAVSINVADASRIRTDTRHVGHAREPRPLTQIALCDAGDFIDAGDAAEGDHPSRRAT